MYIMILLMLGSNFRVGQCIGKSEMNETNFESITIMFTETRRVMCTFPNIPWNILLRR